MTITVSQKQGPLKFPLVTYDRSVDAAYIYLCDISNGGVAVSHTVDLSGVVDILHVPDGNINLDFDSGGRLVGIEVLAASTKLPMELLK